MSDTSPGKPRWTRRMWLAARAAAVVLGAVLLVAPSFTDFVAWAASPQGLGQPAWGAWVVALGLTVFPVVLVLRVGDGWRGDHLWRRRPWGAFVAAWVIIIIGAVVQWEAGRPWSEILIRPVTLAIMFVTAGPETVRRSVVNTIRRVLQAPLVIMAWVLDTSRSPYRKKLSGVIVLAGYMSWVAGRFFDAAFADLSAYFTSMSTINDVWSCIYLPPQLSSQMGTPLWLHVAFSVTLLILLLWALGLLVAARVLLCVYVGVVVVWNACQAARLGGVRAYTASIADIDDIWQRIYLPPQLSSQMGTPLWLHVAFSATLLFAVLVVFLQLVWLLLVPSFMEQERYGHPTASGR
ncbi:hypothetical protein [Sphaerisporangium rhizosphaerae]|uniref:Uncharacterized protein n=1 Tax=Sphaerisporangium rhizosphaerae TaxID=2269375 RepID=A0ABW2PDS6_9ACTN